MTEIPDEYVKALAEQAGRAGAREVIEEMKILPRIEAAECNITKIRVVIGRMIGIGIGGGVVIGVVLKLIGLI